MVNVTVPRLLGGAGIIDGNGNLHTPKGLADAENSLQVPVIDAEGRLTSGGLGLFQESGDEELIHVITLGDGTVIQALEDQQILTASGEWVYAGDLTMGYLLRAVVYNPRLRKPQMTVREVTDIDVVRLKFPTETYALKSATTERNILVTETQNRDDSWTLLCVSLSRSKF